MQQCHGGGLMNGGGEPQCGTCAHAWSKPATRWEPEDGGCAIVDSGRMTEEENTLSEIGKCPYYEEREEEYEYISFEDD